ncbi:EAL domain-containing protein [Pseudokordiimonas caeni]|uniref:EAL domain-containing protein n=1 Tax=Pseudokordiimonas caeni TaxID=2997908 RepID=UPI002812440E|nr:EAL domain-containing protein [Pseudokordiimonas caeni]
MKTQFDDPFHPLRCSACRDPESLGFDFTMAFQPIWDIEQDRAYAYEALVRGVNGEGAGHILSQVTDANRYRFDQACRVKAIELAYNHGILDMPDCKVSINFLPNAVYRPETCIRATLEIASGLNFPLDRIMFEVTEGEKVQDTRHLKNIFDEYRRHDFTTAIDDFGAGYSGLNLLATFHPHVLKLDMELIRDIDSHPSKAAIVAGVLLTASRMDIEVIAEGVETRAELETLRNMGVRLIQGYLLARPQTGCLPAVAAF